MLAPGDWYMKGAFWPQGLGSPIQSGMQELTRWLAVVLVAKGGQFCSISSFCCRMRRYSSYRFLSRIIFKYSISVSGVGGSPSSIRFLAFSKVSSSSSLWFWYLMMLAWHMLSSEMVAFILRVSSLSLLWNSLIFSLTSRVDCLPSVASVLSLSTRLLTSSRMSSFSRSCSFLLLSLSSMMLILASRASSSGSSPSSSRHRSLFSGSSSCLERSFSWRWTSRIWFWSSSTFSAQVGTSMSIFWATATLRSFYAISILIMRISSYTFLMFISVLRRMFSWMLDFSQRMQSSSLRSMSWMPVRLRFSQASSYCSRSPCMSFCRDTMIMFSFSISLVFWSTSSFFSFFSRSYLLSLALVWSRLWISSCSMWLQSWMVLFFSLLSFFRISSSFCRILIRSFSSARSCEEFWIKFTYLFRADFTSSYSALKCYNLLLVSSYFLVRSRISNSFTFNSSRVQRTSVVAEDAFRAIDSLVPVESLISFWRLLTIFLRSVRLASYFLISVSKFFLMASLLAVLALMVSVLSTTRAVSSLISCSLVFWSRISEVMMVNSFLIFSMTSSVSLMTSCCCSFTTSCFLYSRFSFCTSFLVLLIFSASPFTARSTSLIECSRFSTSTFNCPRTISFPLIMFLIDSMAVPISSVSWKDSSLSTLSCSICSFCCSIFSRKVEHIFSLRSISSLRSLSSLSMPMISMLRFSALLAQWSGESLILSLISLSFSSSSSSSAFSFLMWKIFCMFSSKMRCRFSMVLRVLSFIALFSWMSTAYLSSLGCSFSSTALKSSFIFCYWLTTSFSSSSASKRRFSQEAFWDQQATSAVLRALDSFSVYSVTSAWRLLAASYSCLMLVRSFLRTRMVSLSVLQFFWESLMILKRDLMTPETWLNCSSVSLPCLQKYCTDSVPYFMFMAIRFSSLLIPINIQLIYSNPPAPKTSPLASP